MGKLQVVVGAQFGSEGKGHVAAHLSAKEDRLWAVRVAGPNAGHSVVDTEGRKWALRQLPVAAVANPDARLVIAAGSEIDQAVLQDEIKMLEDAGFKVNERLYLDGAATVIEPGHKFAEEGMFERIGSTQKGIGVARAERIMRRAMLLRDFLYETHDTAALLQEALVEGATVQVEGTQGYGLGLHTRFYPYTTSSDCRAIDFLAMAGINPWVDDDQFEIWVVARTHPIRVAGNSGPLEGETNWEALGFEPELTTVTGRVRRVGAWDEKLVEDAIAANGSTHVRLALTFADYWWPEIHGVSEPGVLTPDMWDRLEEIEENVGAQVQLLGTGPDTMIEVR